MKMVVPKIGNRLQISTGDFSSLGTVTSTKQIEGGILCWATVDDMEGREYQILFPDDAVTDGRTAYRQGRSEMPATHVCHTTKDFRWELYGEDTDPQKRICNAFILNFSVFMKAGRGLYIFSKTRGAGKTMLACVLANEILKKCDISMKFISAPDYIELVKGKSDADRERVRALYDASLLILDDIGTEDGKQDWIAEALYRLVDFRYKNHLSTVYTSNLPMGELKRHDDRAFSRIYEVSVPVALPEVSIREQVADRHTRDFLNHVLKDGS